MNKETIIQKVKALDGFTQDERAYLINLVNIKKKQGLVWEDKPEEVEEQLRSMLPLLTEVVDKRVIDADLPVAEGQALIPELRLDIIDEENEVQKFMKTESVHIKNFRSFKNDTIYFEDYTCLVGQRQ